ncbi:MAG TPA: protein-disulfide reductase DsbD domain-containing protein [Candidatus Acidoferrum sp.]|nr:protein-disulfide reductase DsbD domain-containing protein [Candidatus Acidoferrum sp.]
MRRITCAISVGLLSLAGLSAEAAHTRAQLLLAEDQARPGDTVLAGIRLQMDPGWHTYWKNPGDSGMATQIQWQLPPGVTAGKVRWPAPEKMPESGLTTYVYTNEVVLLVPLKLSTEVSPGRLELKATLSWLECEVLCVPGKANVQASLTVGTEPKGSADAPLLERWEAQLPRPGDSVAPRGWWESAPKDDSRPLLVEWNSALPATSADFFPDSSEQYEVQAGTERLPADSGKIRIRKEIKKLSGDWPKEISGLVTQRSGAERLAYDVKLELMSPAPATTANPAATALTAAPPLWQMLVYAFLGGLILNVMPCVLPVIALKILGFVAQAKDEPRRVRQLGVVYGLGVVASFLGLAGLVIGLQAAGHRAGWGMQFGNPQFLVILTALVTLVALNLFGLFEVNLSGGAMNAAGNLASKHGAVGAFFNGVLATILATPCTAPFLSIALGFAFAQKAPLIALTLLTVGLGLASPYVLLSWHPGWLKFLPKPGAWMERFKIAMGFPMLATALWLFSLLPVHYGDRAWWLGIFLVILAFCTWIFGEFVQRGRVRRPLALSVALVFLATGYAGIVEGKIHWRSAQASGPAKAGPKDRPEGIAWKPWTPEAVTAARQERRPVLVDFTADWCLTCNTLVKPALENPNVRQRLEEINAVPLLGDYTSTPDVITEQLTRFGRAGVPLVVVYPKDPKEPPIVLPEPSPLRTPSHYSTIILGALERAGR